MAAMTTDHTLRYPEKRLMTFGPTLTCFVVLPIEDRAFTAVGIVGPDLIVGDTHAGTVIAAPALDRGRPAPARGRVGIGDLVFFPRHSGQEVTIEGVAYLILRPDELMGVTEGGAAAPSDHDFRSTAGAEEA